MNKCKHNERIRLMNINEELNSIIFKYGLDRYYPHYRNMCEAEKILRNIVEEAIKRKEETIFIGDNIKGIELIRNISRDSKEVHYFCYEQNDFELHSLENVQWGKYNNIYLISFYNVEYVDRWLRRHKVLYEWIYNIFEVNGLFLQKEFFMFGEANIVALLDKNRIIPAQTCYSGTLQCEFYSQKNRYKYTKKQTIKRITLEKCLFLALCMKNFILAKEYILLLMNENEKFIFLWKEIEELLQKIKEKVREQWKDNIILYWMDALPYGNDENIPNLESIMNKSIVFENAFTNIAYTSSTARAIFLGKRDIDDGVYDVSNFTEDNSPVMQILKRERYDIKIISGKLNRFFPLSCVSEQFYMDEYAPCSLKLWDMLSNMCGQESRTFYLIHMMETHDPFLSSKISDDNYKDKHEKCRLAKREMDEQIAFYDDFINQKNFRIYMSDHGRESLHKFHVHFSIYQEELHPRKVNEMFSLLDFNVLLEQIVKNKNIEEDKITKEYVEIGNLDKYNKEKIENIIKRKVYLEERDFGCKGIIDRKYIYLCNTVGREQLLRREDIPLCDPLLFYEDEIFEKEQLPKYRKLIGEYPEIMQKAEMFQYSKYLYRLYDNLKKRSSHVPKCVCMINKMLETYKESSVAIRVGGYHSMILYQILSKENKRKIWGFIDKSDKCECDILDMPVISTEQIREIQGMGIEAILLSSYNLLDILREEALGWPGDINVLDIYDYFEKNGIICNTNFYNVLGTDEDYDVGFPFEEVKR